MSIKIIGGTTTGTVLETDSRRNVLVRRGVPSVPVGGGYYAVSGANGTVAASAASSTTFFSMWYGATPGANRRAYIYSMEFMVGAATIGTSGLVAGSLVVNRFSGAIPTGGTQRTVCPLGGATEGVGAKWGLDDVSNMTDVRDSQTGLTTTGIVQVTLTGIPFVPIFISDSTWARLDFGTGMVPPTRRGGRLPYNAPIVMMPGSGILARVSGDRTMPANQTWKFAYNIRWMEMAQ